GSWHHELGSLVAECVVVEEAKSVGRLIAAAPRELPLLDQVGEVGAYLFRRDLIRRTTVVPNQMHDGREIGLVCARREASKRHLSHHTIAQFAHGSPPWLENNDGDECEPIAGCGDPLETTPVDEGEKQNSRAALRTAAPAA